MERMKVDKEMGSDWYTLAVGGGLVKSKHRDTAETTLCSKMEGKPLYMMFGIEVHRPRISVDVPYNLLMTSKYLFCKYHTENNIQSLQIPGSIIIKNQLKMKPNWALDPPSSYSS